MPCLLSTPSNRKQDGIWEHGDLKSGNKATFRPLPGWGEGGRPGGEARIKTSLVPRPLPRGGGGGGGGGGPGGEASLCSKHD